MGVLDTKIYYPDCSMANLDLDNYYNKDKKFGKFIEDGAGYLIEDKNTPRPWLQYLCNDNFLSCITNTGKGFVRLARGCTFTKDWSAHYIIREPYGQRGFYFEVDGIKYDFFNDSEKFTTTVRPGSIEFSGTIEDFKINMLIFVPAEINCECWKINITNNGNNKNIKVILSQDWQFKFSIPVPDSETVTYSTDRNFFKAEKYGFKGIFTAKKAEVSTEEFTETFPDGTSTDIVRSYLSFTYSTPKGSTIEINTVTGAYENDDDEPLIKRCADPDAMTTELSKVHSRWKEITERNFCQLPDKNLEYFLNYWLKNQLYLTYRYDRGEGYVGYRDGLQDTWGYLLVDPEKAKEKLIMTLSHMMPDGKCPRQFYRWSENPHDMRDYSDSVIWVADALTGYIKETGDFDILNEQIPFLNSNEKSTVENHVFRGLDSLYNLRGKNGLIRVRDGDWLDGLGGINKFGDDATSVWITVAAFYAQNVMAKLYEFIGNTEKAELMKKRSAEYKKIVNEVAWDGDWFVYAFFEDGEPIGSHKNLEGKIYLNVQTWAIFSGIVDDEDRITRIMKSVNRYLQTPFGPLLNYPPYVFHGERCGRIQRQKPGTFANSAVYNHAASFKIFADVARGDAYDALDTIARALPNNPDNSDCCRTSEPYSVGNVYYGPNNERFGMNLFAWFTATAAWLIHGGFEAILGVKAGYDGIEINPCIHKDWNSYIVTKKHKGTTYHIYFERSEEKGIWVDNIRINGNIVKSEKEKCNVTVKF